MASAPKSKSRLENRNFKVVGSRPLRPDGIDKVTGRARFGADMTAPGMLVGKILRSPHAHARIKKIDTKAAEKLAGVKAVITSADLPDGPAKAAGIEDTLANIMARDKALYDGHAVAAVAATSESIAREALKLIKVDYEVLPHVTDVEEAMKPGAPILHDDMFTENVTPTPTKPSNVAARYEFGLGDIAKGFKAADHVIERSFRTEAAHQGYIEPHACLGTLRPDGTGEVWVCTQGHYMVRTTCAKLLGLDLSRVRVTASEIGGGFGGKTVVYLEPLALALAKKSGRPVKMVMTREEVLKASGPTSGAHLRVKMGAKKDGSIVAAEADLIFQAGAFQGSPVQPAAMCAFAPYDLANVKLVGYDVVSNRPKVAAYRAPGGPIAEFAVESVVDELAGKLGLDYRQKVCRRQALS